MRGHPLQPFFFPRSVAIIGASRTPGKGGHTIVRNLQKGFSGRIFPINPRADEISGLPAYHSVLAVPATVDLAVILLPAKQVPDAVAGCVAAEVPAVIIESAGFAEAGAEGAALQEEVLQLARGTPTRLWGPNCTGVVNAANGLVTGFVDVARLIPGPVSVIAQSGIMAAALLNQVTDERAFGIAKVATIGNKCDIDEADVLEFLAQDPATDVIAIYVESLNRGKVFIEACRGLAGRKPIVLLKSGRTRQGSRASLSHTGSLAGDDRIVDAIARQYGVWRAEDFSELIDITKGFALRSAPLPRGEIAVLTTTGGGGVVAADLIDDHGLRLRNFPDRTLEAFQRILPTWDRPGNPLDVWSAIELHGSTSALLQIMEVVLNDPGVDGILLLLSALEATMDLDCEELLRVVATREVPLAVWPYGSIQQLSAWRRKFEAGGVPVYRDLRTAVRYLAANRLSGQAFQNMGVPPAPPSTRRVGGDAVPPAGKRLTEHGAKRVLKDHGILVTREEATRTVDEAVVAAHRLGFPVAVKILSPDIPHKTDAGGVYLNLPDETAVRRAWEEVRYAVRERHPDAVVEGVLVQEMVQGATELIAGLVRHKSFGPLLMLGLGGVFVEVLDRVAFRALPLSDVDLDALIAEAIPEPLRSESWRQGPRDLRALRQTLRQIAALADTYPSLEQLDINPLALMPRGQGVKVVDCLMVFGGDGAI